VDITGSTLGSQLNKAFPFGKVKCTAHEAGACWPVADDPSLMYVPAQPDNCDLEWLYRDGEFAANVIPHCEKIAGMALVGPSQLNYLLTYVW